MSLEHKGIHSHIYKYYPQVAYIINNIAYDENDTVIETVTFQLREDGKEYNFYNSDGTPNVEKENEKSLEQAKKNLVSTVEKYIQKEVDTYNKANNMLFKDVHNCATYKDVDTYPHQQFCKDIVAFNAAVWVKARTIESEVLKGLQSMPTEEELISLLPKYEGVA